MLIGKSLSELQNYRPETTKEKDFEEFWSDTLNEFLVEAPRLNMEKAVSPINQFSIFDVTVEGFNRDLIKGWFIAPRDLSNNSPLVVVFDGYGGGRGNPQEWLFWPSCGYPVLVMETRGQGTHRRNDTPDGTLNRDGQASGFLTMGALDRNNYYYRRVFTDAVAFVRAAIQIPKIDPNRIIVTGISQGGGIAIAAAALSRKVFAAMPDVPFLCHVNRAVEMVDTFPYQEIVNFCKVNRHQVAEVMKTLSYFDGMNLATSATVPARFSVGLHDQICPPDTVFAAINSWNGPVDTQIWEFNGHEGGGSDNQILQVKWLERLLGSNS